MEDYDAGFCNFLGNFVSDSKREKIEETLKNRTRKVTVVLEDIYQSHNACAVVRSCECFGIQDMHVIENKNAFDLTLGVVMGAAKWIEIHRWKNKSENTKACLMALKKEGYRIFAATPTARTIVADLDVDGKSALLFGTEEKGLTSTALEMAEDCFRIPMFGFTESFNISVSVALSLYDMTKRLRETREDWSLSEAETNRLRQKWYASCVREPELLAQRYRETKGGISFRGK